MDSGRIPLINYIKLFFLKGLMQTSWGNDCYYYIILYNYIVHYQMAKCEQKIAKNIYVISNLYIYKILRRDDVSL